MFYVYMYGGYSGVCVCVEEKQKTVLISQYALVTRVQDSNPQGPGRYQEATDRCPTVKKNTGALSQGSPYARCALTTEYSPDV